MTALLMMLQIALPVLLFGWMAAFPPSGVLAYMVQPQPLPRSSLPSASSRLG